MTADNRRQISDAGAMIEVDLPEVRQVGEVAAIAEISLGRYRQVGEVVVLAEVSFGRYRQVGEVAVLAEVLPCVEGPGDYGYEEKQFYLEKLHWLNENHGAQVDLTPYTGCISAERLAALKQLYIDHFTAGIRQRVGGGFQAAGIGMARLFEIFVGVASCGEGNYLCMARLGFEEIDDALAALLIAKVRAIIDAPEMTGAKFDARGIATVRLAEIHLAIHLFSWKLLARWAPLEAFPEIEAVIRQRWLEHTFQAVHKRLHAGRELGTHFDEYRRAIEAAFSVTFAVENVKTSYPWGLAAIHFARLGLEAIARKFENWARGQLATPRWLNRYRIFRNIMGSTTLLHVNVPKVHFAESKGDVIEIFQRADPKTQRPLGRQAVLTPNNLIHEFGHSLNRYGGFGEPVVGSLEYAIEQLKMPRDRAGMGQPPFTDDRKNKQLYYEHASVVCNPDGSARFDPLWDQVHRSFRPSSYLLHDLFGDNCNLWRYSQYNYLLPYTTVRVDVFVHSWGTSANETGADAFLNWVRNGFDESLAGRWWRAFMDWVMPAVMRNAALYQKFKHDGEGLIPFYTGKGVIGEYVVGSVLETNYYLRWVPEVPEIPEQNVDAQIGFILGPEGSPVSIYGWWQPPMPIPDETGTNPPSPYWLLVSTKAGQDTERGKLVWVASNAVAFGEHELKSTTKAIDPQRLSPARPFEASDLDIIV